MPDILAADRQGASRSVDCGGGLMECCWVRSGSQAEVQVEFGSFIYVFRYVDSALVLIALHVRLLCRQSDPSV